MKYVWASWGNGLRQFSTGENINTPKTRHIRGYGRAVTFSSTQMAWSDPHSTYTPGFRLFQMNVSQG